MCPSGTDVLRSTNFKEHPAVVVEVLRGTLECVRRVPKEGHEPVIVGGASHGPKCLAQIRVHLFENVKKLIGNMVGFCRGHAVDNGFERRAWISVYVEIPGAIHPFPGVDGSVGEGGMMQNA